MLCEQLCCVSSCASDAHGVQGVSQCALVFTDVMSRARVRINYAPDTPALTRATTGDRAAQRDQYVDSACGTGGRARAAGALCRSPAGMDHDGPGVLGVVLRRLALQGCCACLCASCISNADTFVSKGLCVPSPTLSPTDPVPRGLLTLCPWASSGPQGLYTAYIQPIYSLYTAYMQPIYSLYAAYMQPSVCCEPIQLHIHSAGNVTPDAGCVCCRLGLLWYLSAPVALE